MSPSAGPRTAAGRHATRPRARRRGGAALAALVALACNDAEIAAPLAPRPAAENVLLIVVDTLRADHTSLDGGRATTPRLAELSRESLTYVRAYSQAPWTTPSIGSLLTSRSPTALGIRGDRSPLPEEARLLSEVLADAGFATGAAVSHDYCSARWGFAQGFEWFDESNVRGYQAISAPGVTNLGIAFVEAQAQRPWFLLLHYFDPHFSYLEHRRFAFGGRPTGYTGPIHSRMRFKALYALRAGLAAPDVAELERLYDSEIAFTDHHIGRLLDHLRARKLLDRTLVILTADHGEEFLERGDLGHAKSLYDEVIRVPLLLRVPGVAPARIAQPVGLIDLYPSVLDLLGLPPEPGAAGISLFGRDRRAAAPPRPVFTETSRFERSLYGVVDGRHKLVLDLVRDRAQLYDLLDDPGERRDLASREPERARELRARLEAWIAQQRALAQRSSDLELSAEERERLRELGYLDAGAEP